MQLVQLKTILAQIDYAIDAIDAVPQEMLDDQRVRIATGIFIWMILNKSLKFNGLILFMI